jgi:hypothetical protein
MSCSESLHRQLIACPSHVGCRASRSPATRRAAARLWIAVGLAMLLAGCGPNATTSTLAPTPVSPTATPLPTVLPPTPTMPAPTPMPALAPPESDEPPSGICAQSEGAVVVVEINADVPSPRCLQVTEGQRIEVRNRTNAVLELELGFLTARVEPGGSYTFDRPAGTFLAPGTHVLRGSPYPGPEIWLVAK